MVKNIVKRVMGYAVFYLVAVLFSAATGISIYRSYFVVSILLISLFALLYHFSPSFRYHWILEYKSTLSEDIKSNIIFVCGVYLMAKLFHMDFFVMYMICDFTGALRSTAKSS